MVDYSDHGATGGFPSRWNYTYGSSMYVEDSKSPQGYVRAYTEETRPDKMEGCEPCHGFTSIYYDKCYAKEGNECLGRSYPQCQRGTPPCKQLEQKKKILYNEYLKNDSDLGHLIESNKEGFFGNHDLSEKSSLYIFIIFICFIFIIIQYREKNNKDKTKITGGNKYIILPQPRSRYYR